MSLQGTTLSVPLQWLPRGAPPYAASRSSFPSGQNNSGNRKVPRYNPAVPAGLFKLTHLIFATLYLALPPLVLIVGSARSLRYPGRRTSLGVLFCSGIVLGAAVAVAHSLVAAAPVPPGQVLISGYFAIGLLLLVRGLDWFVAVALGLNPIRRHRGPRFLAEILQRLGPLLRFAVLISLAFPFVVMTLVCFRPRVVPDGDPASRLRVDYQLVHFRSADDLTLAGWWIPAPDRFTADHDSFGPDSDEQASFRPGSQTVLICHGFWGGKAGPLPIARFYLAAGYNVLLFDFRATGQSQGHLCTFGDLERRDVLGAVAYLRTQRPRQSQRILGLGLGTGGAALLAAAADPSSQGQAIAAVAVIGCYDDLNDLSHQLAESAFLPPLGALVWKVGLPLASLQTGADLQNFRPADAANHLWPRPLMVVHGMDDNVIPFELGQRLYNAAAMPKQSLWIENADADQTAADPGVNRAILRFFNNAHPVPVI